jgi:hypothetical protein
MLDEMPISTKRAMTPTMIKGKNLRLFMGLLLSGLNEFVDLKWT